MSGLVIFLFVALQRLMNAFVDKLFTTKSFEAAYELVSNVDGCKDKNIQMPDGVRYGVFLLIFQGCCRVSLLVCCL
jgi:hypothetical protein